DAELVRDDVRDYVVEHLGSEDAVLVLDETGFVKKGVKSCGVSRQYSGTAGRIENCQIGVFVGYASAKGHAFLDRALYLPDAWTEDLARCKAAEVPKDTAFATKPKLAKAMLERALSAKVPCRWVTGDRVYGKDSSLRLCLEEQGKAYVLAVTGHECACIGLERHPIKHLLPSLPDDGWHRLSAGAGSKGERLYDWAYLPQNGDAPNGWQRGLLVRRSLSDPDDKTAYFTFAPKDTPLATLVRVAGTRWTIERCLQEAKGEVGLDQYEVRSWQGWHRHITLAMLAHAYLAVTRIQTLPQDEDPPVKGGPSNPGNSLREFKRQRGLCC